FLGNSTFSRRRPDPCSWGGFVLRFLVPERDTITLDAPVRLGEPNPVHRTLARNGACTHILNRFSSAGVPYRAPIALLGDHRDRLRTLRKVYRVAGREERIAVRVHEKPARIA